MSQVIVDSSDPVGPAATLFEPAFYQTMKTKLRQLNGLDLSAAASLVSIGAFAFGETNLEGTLMIPANVETIGLAAFYQTKLAGLDLSNAASLVSIADWAFYNTYITSTIETPFTVPTYAANSFPPDVTIVKVIPGLKKCAVAPSGTEPCWELADPTMTDIPQNFLQLGADLTGTLKLGAAVKTIGTNAFSSTKLTGLDLSDATSLVSIGYGAFRDTDITGTLVIPAKVQTIGRYAF